MREFERTSPEIREILGRRIDQLGLKLEGSPVERFVLQLQGEIRRKGLKKFQAVCYLSDEWVDTLALTCATAERLGLRLAMNLGQGWPPGGPWITDQHRSRHLT